ncbi:MAG: FtsX-like permease family protein [Desulfofustis sp.]|nr:FtsX-like permease family protein [Desulfofustis sp.]
MMIHYRFLLEELRYGGKQVITFVICVALSIATLTALNSFRRDVHGSLIDEARELQGGDIIIHAHQPISDKLQLAVDSLAQQNYLKQQKTFEFYTVVLSEIKDSSLLSSIKAVESAYPFFGTITLTSGLQLGEALEPGTVVVAQEVLDRLDRAIGDRLIIGDVAFTIADVVAFESMRPVSFLSFGPRIFISMTDLDQLGLLGRGSRVEHELLLQLSEPGDAEDITKILSASAVPRVERVETAASARSRVRTFFDNLLFFLSCISILTLMLSGIGMQGSLSAILYQKQKVIAVTKAFGASNRFLLTQYLIMVSFMGAFGSLIGIGLGYTIKRLFPLLLGDLVPQGVGYAFHPADTLEGIVLGILVVTVFTLLPLHRLGTVKPVMIFRHETGAAKRQAAPIITGIICSLFLSLLVIRQIDDVKIGIFFVLGLVLLIATVSLTASACLWLLKRAPLPTLALRQAAKSLYRPGNASRSIIVTLTSAISVLLVIFLLKLNLFATFIESYPENAPNLFCIDIQQDQKDLFQAVVGEEVLLFPVIRARLLSINDQPIDPVQERERKTDNLGREFNLTYRENLLDDEIIIGGNSLFEGTERLPPGVVALSVLDSIAEIGEIELDDRMRFNIQGVEIEAQVTSIRSRTESRLYPFFYFVFEPATLEAAPQTFFSAIHLPRELIPDMITAIVAQLPNVSTINVADVADRFGQLMKRLSVVITFFASFSIMAGCLILISTIFATRLDRIRETVYYKVLGADSNFVLLVLTCEHAMLALFSSIMAVIFAEVAAWLICTTVFNIVYQPHWYVAGLTVVCSIVLVIMIGLTSSFGIIQQRPAVYLRQQNGT